MINARLIKRNNNRNYSHCEMGDLVFFKPIKHLTFFNWQQWIASKIIEIVSPKFIHVGFIINEPRQDQKIKIFSAEREGIKERFVNDNEDIIVLRVKVLKKFRLLESLKWAYQFEKGKPYGYLTALRAGALRFFRFKSIYHYEIAKVCSTLIDKILKNAGVDLIEDIHNQDVLPDDLYYYGIKNNDFEEVEI